VTAIGAGHDVVGAQGIAHPHSNRLLADREMHRALDLIGRIDVCDDFFEPPCQVELPVEPFERLTVRARCPIRHANTPSIAVQQSPTASGVNVCPIVVHRF
jgi:hypothetical protein